MKQPSNEQGFIPIHGCQIPGIHNQVARVLLASAILFSLLFGGSILLYETWRAAGRFEAMAISEVVALTAYLTALQHRSTVALNDTTIASFLAERHMVPGGHFVAIRVADDTGRVIANATAHNLPSLPKHAKYLDAIMENEPPYKEIVWRNGEWFVLVVQKISGIGEIHADRFLGVFHIEPETWDHVISVVMEAVTLITLTVLLTTGLLYPIITRLHRDLVVRSNELLRSHAEILQALGSAIAKRDSDTYLHNFRVTFYAVRLAEAATRAPDEIASLIKGAFLHDIGKIAISDTILLKPGRLTDEEMTIMRTHVMHGVEMLRNISWLADAKAVVEGHHEQWDGTGYPMGKSGETIPITARIFAIADVFDALTSSRPYKDSLPLEQVVKMMRAGRATHFDPYLLDIFLPLTDKLLKTARKEATIAETVFQLAGTYLK